MMQKPINKIVFMFILVSVTLSSTTNEFSVVSTSPKPKPKQDNTEDQSKTLQKVLDQMVQEQTRVIPEIKKTIEDLCNKSVQKLKNEVEAQRHLLESNAERLQGLEKQISEINQSLNHLKTLPKNCREVQDRGNKDSGIYHIRPELSSESFGVLCDMKVQEGGWTYIMNRFDGSQDFYQNWTEYKQGFGNLFGEFWLGLERVYQLTNYKNNELLIELVDWDNKKAYAHYENFSIDSEKNNYALKVLNKYSGDVIDSFSYHLNMNFSTADNSKSRGGYCASYFKAAWWYKDCFTSHLTGLYLRGNSSRDAKQMGIHWNGFQKFDYSYSLKQARMMVRPSMGSPVLLPHERMN